MTSPRTPSYRDVADPAVSAPAVITSRSNPDDALGGTYPARDGHYRAVRFTGDNFETIHSLVGMNNFVPISPRMALETHLDAAVTAQLHSGRQSTWVGVHVGDWIVVLPAPGRTAVTVDDENFGLMFGREAS